MLGLRLVVANLVIGSVGMLPVTKAHTMSKNRLMASSGGKPIMLVESVLK